MAIPSKNSVTNGSPAVNGNGTATADYTPLARGAMPEPIAICGMGLRLPGGIQNGEDFWQLLINGRDARAEIPTSRFAIDGFDASLSGQAAIHTRHGYFLEDDLSRLDTSFFSMSKAEIERCDPQQRLLLEVVRECFEDAGEVNYRGQPIGCYVGTFGQDWFEMATKDIQSMGNYAMMGCNDLVLANRVSYEFDLRGPRYRLPFELCS
jgi:acyl transferase domain-containing protein